VRRAFSIHHKQDSCDTVKVKSDKISFVVPATRESGSHVEAR